MVPVLVVLSLLISTPAAAQFELGASYELRDNDPESGFGIRVQRSILERVPLLDLGMRLHFSYFSEDNRVNRDGVSYSRDFSVYDFGAAAYGGVSLGLMQPYAGIGLGSETTDLTIEDFQGAGSNEPEEGDESNLYWNTFVGAKVTLLPVLKPFVEYRYSNKELSKPDLADAQNGRIIFGVLLSF